MTANSSLGQNKGKHFVIIEAEADTLPTLAQQGILTTEFLARASRVLPGSRTEFRDGKMIFSAHAYSFAEFAENNGMYSLCDAFTRVAQQRMAFFYPNLRVPIRLLHGQAGQTALTDTGGEDIKGAQMRLVIEPFM